MSGGGYLEPDRQLVAELLAVDSGLTDWEVRFAESLSQQVDDEDRALSDRQREVVEGILRRLGR